MRLSHAAIGMSIWNAEGQFVAVGIDWRAIGETSQAVSALGTVISMLALLGAMHSLRLQRRQARAFEEEGARAMRNDLMLLALQNEKYLPLWGFPRSAHADDLPMLAYPGMEFNFFEISLRSGRMTELELERSLSNIFRQRICRDFWRDSRRVYLDSGDPSAVRLGG